MPYQAICVLSRPRYRAGDVYRLARLLSRHLAGGQLCLTVLTDQPEAFPERVVHVDDKTWVDLIVRDISGAKLPGWFAKMAAFDPAFRSSVQQSVYVDLDTLPCGDLRPLFQWEGEFGICANFTRAAGNEDWPCRYGSCVMSFGPGFGHVIWSSFWLERVRHMQDRYGDQKVIEGLKPDATILQDVLPPGFFLGYRDLWRYPEAPPQGTGMVVYAGARTPMTMGPKWAAREWNR